MTYLHPSKGACLVNKLAAKLVVLVKDATPQVRVHALNYIARLRLEQRVAIGAIYQSLVASAALVGHTCKVGVALLAVLAHCQRIIIRVCSQEVLRIVVGVYDNLAQRIVNCWVCRALAHKVLQERIEQLEAVALLDLRTAYGQVRAYM